MLFIEHDCSCHGLCIYKQQHSFFRYAIDNETSHELIATNGNVIKLLFRENTYVLLILLTAAPGKQQLLRD